jgi:D-tyrosyl-tRNA(Tyr) deacylase
MRACVQRVSQAQVSVAGEICGQIGPGLVVLLGVAVGDTLEDTRSMAEKVVTLRIFDDADGKMNLALGDVSGALLVVSQFTLLGDCRKGRRPSYVDAAPPELAEVMYLEFVAMARQLGVDVATGKFRQHMEVSLTNDGPVTLLLDSRRTF